MKFMIETDHKPLLPLLGSKRLDCLPPRVLRFRLRLARYDYDIGHVPGKLLYTADTLSRSPAPHTANDLDLEQEAESYVDTCIANLPASSGQLKQFQEAQEKDRTCRAVVTHTKEGWPNKGTLDPDLIPFWKARGNLTVDRSGMLLYGSRIVIPERQETLNKIHCGHQGIQRCRLRANTSVWWPRISSEIENMVKQCPTCARHFVPRKEPMIPTPLLQYPWQKIGIDLCHLNGKNYLIVVDYFSRYPEALKLPTTTAAIVIDTLKSVFSRFGIPETLVSDNGPQFSSQSFAEFAENYSFQHITSSPYFAQSNGQTERTVQTVKRLLREASDSHLALMTYRSTPFPWCKLSPAELLMGRKIRTNIPLLPDQLRPEWDHLKDFRALNETFKRTQKETYNRHHGVRHLPPLSDDSEVWVTSGEKTSGTVVRAADAPRSYIVDTPSGELRRNRQHLNVVPQAQSTAPGTSNMREPIVTRTGTATRPPDRL